MKSVVLICFVIVAGAYGHDTVQLTDAQKETATQYSVACVKESGVKPHVIGEAKKGNLIDDEDLKKFTLCFYEKAGIVDKDGQVVIETALAKLPSGVDKNEARKVIEDCKTQTGKDKADTVFQIFKCYRQNISTPIFLAFH